ncbi:MAG: cation transporter [Clostridiales bacterium]|nr:cation transporter [Clostridiales bacterium]
MESILKTEKPYTINNSEIIIEGLDCPDCAIGLTKTMKKVEGVNKVEVDFFSGKMRVEHTNELEEIIKQVKKTGYKTKLDQKQEKIVGKKSFTNSWINIGTITTILSGFFILLGAITNIYLGEKNLGNVFFILAIIVGSYEISKRGIASLKVKNLDMNVLMLIAIFGATLIGEFSEGALVVFLFSIGNSLQSFTMSKTKKSISSLIELAPNEALLKTRSGSKTVPVETLKVDDIILIKPGTRIAIDGRVIDGHSMVNQAAITGESIPVEKNIGDGVYAGTINGHGFLEIQVTKVFRYETFKYNSINTRGAK